MRVNFYIDESGTTKDDELFIIGGYYTCSTDQEVTDTQKDWEDKNKQIWTDLAKVHDCDIKIITHRTKALDKYQDTKVYDISKELFEKIIKENIKYVYIQGIKITPSAPVSEEYYLDMASQMIIDTLKQILIDHPLEEREDIILNLTFEKWKKGDQDSHLDLARYENKIKLELEVLKSLKKDASKIKLDLVQTKGKNCFSLALADYICNITFNNIKNKSLTDNYLSSIESISALYKNYIKPNLATYSIYGYDNNSIQQALEYKDFRTLFTLYLDTKKNKTENTSFINQLEEVIIDNTKKNDLQVMNGIISLLDLIYNTSKSPKLHLSCIDDLDIIKTLLDSCVFPSKNIAYFCINSLKLTISNHLGDRKMGDESIKKNGYFKTKKVITIPYISHLWNFNNRKSAFYLDQFNPLKTIESSEQNIKEYTKFTKGQETALLKLDLPLNIGENTSLELGKMYGTCGQGYMLGALLEKSPKTYKKYIKKAQDNFEKACDYFSKNSDKLQQYNYIMHLARVSNNIELFEEYLKKYAKMSKCPSFDFIESCCYILALEKQDTYTNIEIYSFMNNMKNNPHQKKFLENSNIEDFITKDIEKINNLDPKVKIHHTHSQLGREALRLHFKINPNIDPEIKKKLIDNLIKTYEFCDKKYKDNIVFQKCIPTAKQIFLSLFLIDYENIEKSHHIENIIREIIIDTKLSEVMRDVFTELLADMKNLSVEENCKNIRAKLYY